MKILDGEVDIEKWLPKSDSITAISAELARQLYPLMKPLVNTAKGRMVDLSSGFPGFHWPKPDHPDCKKLIGNKGAYRLKPLCSELNRLLKEDLRSKNPTNSAHFAYVGDGKYLIWWKYKPFNPRRKSSNVGREE
jgi:hypothetical protein